MQGNHLCFAPGEYTPASPEGRALIGHEIARGEPARTVPIQVRGQPRDQLVEILGDPMVRDVLPELVPLLKVSDVLPCLQSAGLAALLIPCLSPAQCKLLGPELAALVGPHLALCWPQVAHIPLETLVLVPPSTFRALPAAVLRTFPPAHQSYLALYVKRVRKPDPGDHDLALCEALCQILHLHAHKILDPEHIPEPTRLRALRASCDLTAMSQTLRWLVDAVMSDAVKVVQLGALKLAPLIVELRRVGLRALAGELAQLYQSHKHERGLCYGADAIAYTDDHVIALRRQPITGLGGLAGAVRDAVLRHATLRDDAGAPARRTDNPLPTARYVPVIALDFASDLPRLQAQQALELGLRDQLSAPSLGITIEEVCVRWPNQATVSYRRRRNGRYRAAAPRFTPA